MEPADLDSAVTLGCHGWASLPPAGPDHLSSEIFVQVHNGLPSLCTVIYPATKTQYAQQTLQLKTVRQEELAPKGLYLNLDN